MSETKHPLQYNGWLKRIPMSWIVLTTNIPSGNLTKPTPLKNHGLKVSWDDDIPN